MDERTLNRLALEAAAGGHRVSDRRNRGCFAFSVAASGLVVLAWLQPRPDLAGAAQSLMFWLKLALPLLCSRLAWIALARSAHPGANSMRPLLVLLAGLVLFWSAGMAQSAGTDGRWPADLLGTSWRECPLWIAGLSLPMMLATFGWLRRQGPLSPRLSGALAGLACGLAAAALYALHCRESLLFAGVWYLAGALVPAAAGALAGKKLLSW